MTASSTLDRAQPVSAVSRPEKLNDQFIDQAFNIPASTHFLSGLVWRFPRLFQFLGNLESASLKQELAQITIDRPIYISGIARSGSTILLEALTAHSDSVTHRYRDSPFLHIPYWWNQSQAKKAALPVERAHGDGILVTDESPEAMEEVLWQSFFHDLHNPAQSQVFSREMSHPKFETFYTQHIQKLLHLRGGARYVSKGNYNLTRLAYLQRLFPDARCIIPIRRPAGHIASLMKQQALFESGETKYPRALDHMRRVGHYEFGLDRRPINVGDTEAIQEIETLWKSGETVRGWARYWAHLYTWVARQLATDEQLRAASLVVWYEDLCSNPQQILEEIRLHCELKDDGALSNFATNIHAPDYYKPKFTDSELQIIEAETAHTIALFHDLNNAG